MILRWQENLFEDEMPPKWMWSLDDDLNDHFDRVRRDRNSKYGVDSDSHDDHDDYETVPGGMMQNSLAKNRGRNAR